MKEAGPNFAGRLLGVTLVELLISILLGSLLALGVVKVYLESLRQYVVDDDMARMQENGRYALKLLSGELRQAGFYGGLTSLENTPPQRVARDCTATGYWALDTRNAVEFIDDFGGSMSTHAGTSLSCVKASTVQAGADVLAVKRTANRPTLKNGSYTAGVSGAKNTQWYLRLEHDGASGSWFYNKSSGFPSGDVGAGSNTDFWEVYTKVFFIRKYSAVASDRYPTLCVAMLAGNGMDTECLVEGVEDMQLTFGVDFDGDGVANRFLSDPNAPEVSNAVSVQISVLLRGANAISGYSNEKSFQLGKKQIQPKNDAFLRRVMTSTVQLRNLAHANI